MLLLRCAQQVRPLSTRLTAPAHVRLRGQWEALTCTSNFPIIRPLATRPPTKPTTKPAIKANSTSLPSKSPTGKPSLSPPLPPKAARVNLTIVYPIRLPIYHAGMVPTLAVGVVRVSSIIALSLPLPFLLFGHTDVASVLPHG